jgi:hypothetical protein
MSGKVNRNNLDDELILNATVDDDYVSELQKDNRDSAYEARSKNMTIMKIALLSSLAIMATVLLIVCIVTLAGRDDKSEQYTQEYNMFKGTHLFKPYPLLF